MQDDQVHIAEYFDRIEKTRDIVMLSDGSVHRADQLPGLAKQFFMAGGLDPEGIPDEDLVRGAMQLMQLEETRRRKATSYEVKRRVLSGAGVLAGEDRSEARRV